MATSRKTSLPPADGSIWAVQSREHFDRKLGRPHLAAIGISGTLGIGLFVTSGELIGITGSLGAFLAYIIAAVIASCVMYTLYEARYGLFAEMVAARPVLGALVDFPNTFVSAELGFTVGVTYWLAQVFCMASLNAATARTADNFSDEGLDQGQRVGLIIGLVVVTALSNLIGVKKYGQLERLIAIFKLLLIVLLAVLTIGLICGLGGPRNAGADNQVLDSDASANITRVGWTPGWVPDGFRGLLEYNERTLNRTKDEAFGIPGKNGGRLFAMLIATSLAMYSCMGGDQVIVTAGEARDPFNDLPAVTQFIYAIPLTIYPLLTLLIGFCINYSDVQLHRPWAADNLAGSHSPFIIAFRHASLGALPKFLNACFMVCAYTSGNTALYVSSRTLFYVSQEYGTPWMRNMFGTTNATHTPQKAIIFTSLFGLLGLLGLADTSYDQPVLTMSAFFTGIVGCCYVSECWAFIKYKKGLDMLAKRTVFSRDHPLYRKYLLRGHWQPFFAYLGIIGSAAIVVFSGIPSIWLLCNRDRLASKDNIKRKALIATDLIGAYSGPVIFFAIYGLRRLIHGSERRDPRKFQITHYALPDSALFAQQPVQQVQSPVTRNSSFAAVKPPSVEGMIEQHLQGHGRVFRKAADGSIARGRGFWTELSMFIWDREFPDTTDVELEKR